MSDPVPSERELELLKVLWELGEASVRQVHEQVSAKTTLAFNTVQTQLRIMEDKGLVSHRADGRVFWYRPTYSRERLFNRFLRKVFDGARADLMLTMLRSERISAAELKKLEQIIADARRQNRSQSK